MTHYYEKIVLAVTGIQSEYDILYPVLDVSTKDSKFDLSLVVCVAHLSDWHGFTLKEMEGDGLGIVDEINYG